MALKGKKCNFRFWYVAGYVEFEYQKCEALAAGGASCIVYAQLTRATKDF